MNTEKLYKSILDSLSKGVYVVDKDKNCIFWNKTAEKITGYSAENIIGMSCKASILSHIDKNGELRCISGCPLFQTLEDGLYRIDEVLVKHHDGSMLAVDIEVIAIYDDNNEIIAAMEIFSPKSFNDNSGDLVSSLADMVMHDPLTKLFNRRYVESFVNYKLNELIRYEKNNFCIIFFDIDNFRFFNNTYGHDVGDLVLKAIATECNNAIRKSDVIGRWGGEEFVGVFEIEFVKQAVDIAEKIRELVENLYINHNGEQLNVTISVGVTIAKTTDTIETLIKRADELMYQSKKKNKNCVTSDIDL